MRHLFLILDMSQSMEDQDLRPTRLLSCLKVTLTKSPSDVEARPVTGGEKRGKILVVVQ